MKLESLCPSICRALFGLILLPVLAGSDKEFNLPGLDAVKTVDAIDSDADQTEAISNGPSIRRLASGIEDNGQESRRSCWNRNSDSILGFDSGVISGGNKHFAKVLGKLDSLTLWRRIKDRDRPFWGGGEELDKTRLLIGGNLPRGKFGFEFGGPSFRYFELFRYLNPLAFRSLGFGFCLNRLHLVKMETNKDSGPGSHPANQSDDKRQIVNACGGFEKFEHWMMVFSALICGLGVGFAIGVWYARKSSSENSLPNASDQATASGRRC